MSNPTPPKEYHNVSQSQLSIARHYGGCTINGEHYTYIAKEDKLVLTSELKKRRKKK